MCFTIAPEACSTVRQQKQANFLPNKKLVIKDCFRSNFCRRGFSQKSPWKSLFHECNLIKKLDENWWLFSLFFHALKIQRYVNCKPHSLLFMSPSVYSNEYQPNETKRKCSYFSMESQTEITAHVESKRLINPLAYAYSTLLSLLSYGNNKESICF